MTRTCWSRTEQKTRNVAGESSSVRNAACQQWEICKERVSIRVNLGNTLGVLRKGPHAQQSSNMSDEAARVEPSRELGVSRDRHLRYRAKHVNDERYAQNEKSIRVKPGVVLGILREGPSAHQSLNRVRQSKFGQYTRSPNMGNEIAKAVPGTTRKASLEKTTII